MKSFRIAFREDGEFWRVYMSALDTMANALELGSIRITLVRGDDDETAAIQSAFREVFTMAMARAVRESTGGTVDHWTVEPGREAKP